MFTGLIAALGTLVSLEARGGTHRIAIAAPEIAARLHTGDSVAVSGVCLTALDIVPPIFHADLAQETIERTSLLTLEPGARLNLELPTPAGTPLGGHIVQGHVDGAGTMLSLTAVNPEADASDWWLRVAVPPRVSRCIVEKGSIAIEGISLTIARIERSDVDGDVISVAVIPHTYAATNLHSLKAGQPVNIEADVILKFAQQRGEQQPEPQFELTLDYLVANGY